MQRAILSLAAVALLTVGLAAPVMAASPGNDVYAGREAIGSLPFDVSVDTTEATTDADDAEAAAACGAPFIDASVWYEFTPDVDTQVTISGLASDYSVGIIVVSGSPGSFEFQGCGVSVNLALAAGVAYGILVFDYDGVGNGGNLELSMSVAPAAPTVAVSVAAKGSFNARTGVATIRGTVTCTGGTFDGKNYIEVQLSQSVGRIRISGSGFALFACDGTAEAWSAAVPGDNGRFAGGKAVVSVFAVACGPFDCGFDESSTTVTLRK